MGVMTAAGADPEAGMMCAKIGGEKEKAVESVNFDLACTVPPSFSAPTRRASLATSYPSPPSRARDANVVQWRREQDGFEPSPSRHSMPLMNPSALRDQSCVAESS